MTSMAGVVRGCGRRQKGAVYLEVGLSPSGRPVEAFLVDPPIKLNEESQLALGVTPVGVKLVERLGHWNVMDWIGSTSYPNVADWIEETRRFGISRRIPKTIDFTKITADSELILIHSRGWINDRGPYLPRLMPCPRKIESHLFPEHEMCAGLYWEDIEGGFNPSRNLAEAASHLGVMPLPKADREQVLRGLGSTDYFAYAKPEAAKDDYTPAIFAVFKIMSISVIRTDDGSHLDTLQAASNASVPVSEEDA